MMEVRKFFEEYKSLEKNAVVVEKFLDRAEALRVVADAINLYESMREELRPG